jgi:hypothetical protein
MAKVMISSVLRYFLLAACFISLVLSFQVSAEGGFLGGASPSRFELSASAGDVVKRTLSIYNLGKRPTQFQIKTVDWDYSEDGVLSFQEDLDKDSCRPWVRLERHKINVPPSANRPRKFRFEMHIPDNTPAHECRFAIMLSSLGDPYNASLNDGTINLPITGSIAIVVYLMVGDVKPEFVVDSLVVHQQDGRQLPAIKVTNKGAAHGRLDGDFTGVDAKGNKLELFISNSPILPGQTRLIALSPDVNYKKDHPMINYPLTLTGKIYTDNKTFNIETKLSVK